MSLTVGMKLGHYEIEAPIGAGGMGEVFRATDTKLGRAIALKVLPAVMASDPERLARFQREARAVAALNHPNIVTIHSVEEANGIHFLTMELVEGQSLGDLIPERGLPIDRILATAVVLADALAAAHEKGIVHRDLKPANIMMTSEGRLKVLDFGLAKDMHATDTTDATAALTAVGLTQMGVVMGTPAYMSPEQVAGRAVDHRTDIFSLGVILYQMASGRRPFDGITSIEVASAILRDAPRPLNEIRLEAPAELARLIRRCLEKDPQRRVQTARDVGNELLEITRPATGMDGSAFRPSLESEGFWVAVLPFKHTGGNAELTALADGLSEEIVTGLSRFSYLRVIARSSTLRYANSASDVRTIGKEIGARYVMEGSIRQAGAQLRVAVQLIDATTGAHLWAETYNRSFQPDTIFDLQDDLVPRIVSTVADCYGVLPHSMSEAVRGRRPEDMTPHEAVLRAAGYYERITPDEHAEVRACLEHAVEKAPDHADVWAYLSACYQDEYRIGCNPRPDPLGRALAAARRAVEIAPSNHIAHQILASAMFFRRDLAAFRREAERTLALNPMDGSAVALIGTLMADAGDWERGCALVERGRSLNPHHAGWYWFVPCLNAYRQHDYAGALDAALKVNLPGYFYAQAILAAAYGQLGEREAAGKALAHLVTLRPDFAEAAREEWNKWLFAQPDLVEHLLEGLRKAGLDVSASESRVTSGAHATPSIAVLPFANLSADKDQEYFSDGLAEEILNLLAHVSGLKVIARTSAFAFRGKEQDIREIATTLGVQTILQGSVRRAGSRLRVTAQLIDAAGGDHLWSERFDREMMDVFAVQDEIAAAIARALKVTLTVTSGATRHEPKLPAYEALLKGRHYYSKFSPEDFKRAEECLHEAATLDPLWAEPHSALADLYFAIEFYGWQPLEQLVPRARTEAQKAIELLPSDPMAHVVLCVISGLHEHDWKEADEQCRLALESDSVPPGGRMLCAAFYCLPRGRFDDAVREIAKVVAQDPLNSMWRARQAWILLWSEKMDESIAAAEKAIELDARNYQARMMLALAYWLQGKMTDAREHAEQMFRLGPFDSFGRGLLAGFLSKAGEKDRAQQLITEMTGAIPIGMAIFHIVTGELDAAIEWYRKDLVLHRPNAPMIATAPFLKPLREHPRWPEIAKMMNL